MNSMKLKERFGKGNQMKLFFTVLMLLVTSGITMAIDSPNTPPPAERKMKTPPTTGSENLGPGHEGTAKERGEIRERPRRTS